MSMTTDEKITVLTAFDNGEEIEVKHQNIKNQWQPTSTPIWDFSTCDYRVKPEADITWFHLWEDGRETISKDRTEPCCGDIIMIKRIEIIEGQFDV